jgi:hypothetical protein
MEDNSLEDRFLISYFNEEEGGQDLFNELILGRIEQKMVDKLAPFYTVVEAEDDNEKSKKQNDDSDDEGEDGEGVVGTVLAFFL